MIDAEALLGGDDRVAEQAIRSLNRTTNPIPDHAVLAVWEMAERALDRIDEALLAAFVDRYADQLPETARTWRESVPAAE